MADPIDTNVVIRYFIEDPGNAKSRFRGVFTFFEKIERGETVALLPPLVVFQSFFVLTSYYEVPPAQAAAKLRDLLSFQGLSVPEKMLLRSCLGIVSERSIDLVDAYVVALCQSRRLRGAYSFDDDLRRLGVELLPVE